MFPMIMSVVMKKALLGSYTAVLVLALVFGVSVVLGDEFSPADNYLIDCGSLHTTFLDDGRIFFSDSQSSSSYLSTDKDVVIATDSSSDAFFPLHLTARIFTGVSMYRFPIEKPGWHWIRFYFYPVQHKIYNLSSATFTVTTDHIILLQGFSAKDIVFKEYLINITSSNFTLTFSPARNSIAFINGVEVVSAPDSLISDNASVIPSGRLFVGLTDSAIEVSHRLNIGGPLVTSKNDKLHRTWLPDSPFMIFPQGAKNVSVPSDRILYPGDGIGPTPLIAPPLVYSTADRMADPGTSNPDFNLTWQLKVDPSFSYLIRFHFCDIVSNALNELYFNVYINEIMCVMGLDLSTLTLGLDVPYHMDFVLDSSSIKTSTLIIQVGPSLEIQTNMPDAILNGLEVMKLSNSAGNLDGFSPPKKLSFVTKVAAIVSLAFGVIALILLLIRITIQRQKVPLSYQKQRTLTSWLLALPSNQFSFLSSKTKISSTFSTDIDSGLDLGKRFTLSELRDATRNFSESTIVGVGGFGNVYVGELEDGSIVAVKRGNSSSSQGMNEFQMEIQLLSKLRHRHLVSLIGYCDEQSEMILVYEYMSNGSLRNHLYNSSLPPLSWKQRLEICIGAARGLHYLHTGSTHGMIIHRDVKTTNILLDENFVAKVSDFGLSKAGPASLDQTHVTTAVKGSFGYLDPEYFKRKQLTDKSDVYSFGVVLFEVVCARPALDTGLSPDEVNLAEWAKKQKARGMTESIIDPRIADSIHRDSLILFIDIAEKCLADYGIERPAIGDVLWHLEYALQIQETKEAEKRGANSSEEMTVDISENSGVAVYSPVLLHGR